MKPDLLAETVEQRLRALEHLAAGAQPPGAELIEPLVEVLVDGAARGETVLQRRAADLLARIADRAAVRTALLPSLRGGGDGRWAAAYALFLSCGPTREVLPACFEALGHADGDRRWAAAEMAVALGHREPIGPELRSLVQAGEPVQRKMALYCIRDLVLDDPGTIDVVVAALDDDEVGVRLAALAALRVCGRTARVAEAIVHRLEHDGDPGVRRAAASALGAFLAVPAARAALARAASDGDAAVGRAARGALARSGT